MKKLLPLIMLILGLGAGVGAGMVLKPAPEPVADACAAGEGAEDAASHAAGGHDGEGHDAGGHDAAPCPEAAPDPFAAHAPEEDHETKLAYVPLEKSFVVPIFRGDRTVAMMVVGLSVATPEENAELVGTIEPRLRDSFLKVMFAHANSGGFDGSFTTGQKMDDLRAALLAAAREVMKPVPVSEVLVTEIARQDT